MNVLVYGGNWVTNIGNAFLDYGTMGFISKVLPNANIIISSKFPQQVLYGQNKRNAALFSKIPSKGPKNFAKQLISSFVQRNTGANPSNASSLLKVSGFLEGIDFIFINGTCLCPAFLQSHYDVLRAASSSGTKIVISGGGMGELTYKNTKRIEAARNLLRNINPFAVITRDKDSWDMFGDIGMHSYDGIDSAWFLSEKFKPYGFTNKKYIALNFDNKREPLDDWEGEVVRLHHDCWNYGQERRLINSFKRNNLFTENLRRNNVFLSDVPDDFLNIYANAHETHSTRVHACVASLIYGTPARFYDDSPRVGLFERVGIVDLTKKLYEIKDNSMLNGLKKAQVTFLKSVIDGS